jgi:hypothetical protein
MTVIAERPEPAEVRNREPLRFVGPNPTDPRLRVAAVVVSVQVLGQVALGFDLSIAQILVAIGVCVMIELTAGLLRGSRVVRWPASAMLTGNGIALILRVPGTEHGDWWSTRGWWIFAGVAAVAMVTKHTIRVTDRPLFNPSNVGLVLAFVALGEARADPQDLWWGPMSPGLALTYVIIVVGGVLVTRSLALAGMAAAFAAVFAAGNGVVAASGHCMTARWSVDPVCGSSYWWILTTSPEILVFLFFMITDPKTTPSATRPRVAFGVGVAVLASLLAASQPTEFGTKVGILAALVLMCLARPALDGRLGAALDARDGSRGLRVAALGVCSVSIAGALFLIGGSSSAAPTEASDPPPVEVDLEGLPEVGLAPEVREVAAGIEGPTSEAMLDDLVVDLELAALAIERGERELVDLAGVGSWRDERLAEVDAAARGEAVPTRRYQVDEATIEIVGERLSPQSLPQLGVRVVGTEQVGAAEPRPFEGTFTLTRVDGRFLVSADDRDGEISPGEVSSDTVPIDTFADAIRLGTDVDEGSVGDQVPLFADVTDEAGVRVDTDPARLEEVPVPSADAAQEMVRSIPVWTALMNAETYFVTGQAWGDVDGDGWPDLYLTNQSGPNHLLINQGDGTFERAPRALSAPVELADEISGGATWVDVDNDGWRDLHVLSADGGRLFRNEQGRRLVDVTERAGIRGEGKGMTASWADFDDDGDLDAYVANYGCQPCEPNNAPPVSPDQRDQDHLFQNNGDGTFEDRTNWLAPIAATDGLGFVATWIDHDDDGRPDLYLLNDVRDDQGTSDVAAGRLTGDGSTPGNVMIRNAGPGCGGWCFEDVTASTGTERRANAMGVATDDFDGDGRADIFFTNGGFSGGPAGLLRNRGDGTFEESAPARNAHLGEWSWGASSLDVDNDGRRDLFVSVGYSDALQQLPNSELTPEVVARAEEHRRQVLADGTARTPWGYVDPPWPVARDPHRRTDQNRVLLQDQDGVFSVLTVGDASGLSRVHYGNATADFDGDGWTDVVVGHLGDGYSLLRNRAEVGAGHHRLVVRLRGDGERVNRDAVGARVRVTDTDGRVHTGWVRIGGSLGSGSDTALAFGLGSARAESLEVRWPDGTDWSTDDVPTDHQVEVDVDRGMSAAPLRNPA